LLQPASRTSEQTAWDLERALFAAHFTDGEDVGDTETLVRLATSVGLDADAAQPPPPHPCRDLTTIRVPAVPAAPAGGLGGRIASRPGGAPAPTGRPVHGVRLGRLSQSGRPRVHV